MRVGSAEVGGLVEVVEWDEHRDWAWTSVTGIDQRGRWRLREREFGRTHVELRLMLRRRRGGHQRLAGRAARRADGPWAPAPVAAAAQAPGRARAAAPRRGRAPRPRRRLSSEPRRRLDHPEVHEVVPSDHCLRAVPPAHAGPHAGARRGGVGVPRGALGAATSPRGRRPGRSPTGPPSSGPTPRPLRSPSPARCSPAAGWRSPACAADGTKAPGRPVPPRDQSPWPYGPAAGPEPLAVWSRRGTRAPGRLVPPRDQSPWPSRPARNVCAACALNKVWSCKPAMSFPLPSPRSRSVR